MLCADCQGVRGRRGSLLERADRLSLLPGTLLTVQCVVCCVAERPAVQCAVLLLTSALLSSLQAQISARTEVSLVWLQGSFDNLTLIRQAGVACPLLCKEFIVEAYQLFRARVAGADAALLIAAVLPNKDLSYLIKAARKVSATSAAQ